MSKRRTGTPPDERAHALAPECRAPEAPAQWSLIVSAVPSGSAGEPTPTTAAGPLNATDVERARRNFWNAYRTVHGAEPPVSLRAAFLVYRDTLRGAVAAAATEQTLESAAQVCDWVAADHLERARSAPYDGEGEAAYGAEQCAEAVRALAGGETPQGVRDA